ncbi:hypothetical protein OF829_04825 [Sphingomonas sp. LB-2]|uniref:hypothetical protein n=1 Tax=Sphingomonas caeni TaxID=2984949 RepID=UPI00222F0E60|nr:hypothetical protein [Sphingomonas caeni]MCW3846552.1 hypothetical protein [Sphingomonas caeni]
MAKRGAEPEGIGGWLAALLVAIGVIGPVFYLYLIYGALTAQAKLVEYGADSLAIYRVQTALWTLSLVKLVLAWSIVGAMLRFRTRAALRFAIAGIWILGVGMVPVDWAAIALAGAALRGEEPFQVPLWTAAIWISEGLMLVIPATAYLLRSKRVANTYLRAGAKSLEETFE